MCTKALFEIKDDDWKFDDIDLIDEAAYRQHVANNSAVLREASGEKKK